MLPVGTAGTRLQCKKILWNLTFFSFSIIFYEFKLIQIDDLIFFRIIERCERKIII